MILDSMNRREILFSQHFTLHALNNSETFPFPLFRYFRCKRRCSGNVIEFKAQYNYWVSQQKSTREEGQKSNVIILKSVFKFLDVIKLSNRSTNNEHNDRDVR